MASFATSSANIPRHRNPSAQPTAESSPRAKRLLYGLSAAVVFLLIAVGYLALNLSLQNNQDVAQLDDEKQSDFADVSITTAADGESANPINSTRKRRTVAPDKKPTKIEATATNSSLSAKSQGDQRLAKQKEINNYSKPPRPPQTDAAGKSPSVALDRDYQYDSKMVSTNAEPHGADPAEYQPQKDRRLIAEFAGLGYGVKSLSFAPNGFLYVGKRDNEILALDIHNKEEIDDASVPDLDDVSTITATADGKKLLAGGYSGIIQIFEIRDDGSLRRAKAFVGHSDKIFAIAVSEDQTTVASGGEDKRLRIWNLENRRELAAFDGFDREIQATYVAADGSFVLASDGQSIMKVETKNLSIEYHAQISTNYGATVTFSPDGKILAVSGSGGVKLFDTRTFRVKSTLPTSVFNTLGVSRFDATGKYLVTSGQALRQWDWKRERKVNEVFLKKYNRTETIAISNDSRYVAVFLSFGDLLKVYKLEP